MAGVTLDHITKKYGEVTAVNDLNIQIATRSSWCWSARRAAARAPRCG